jgi:hypothetical protein
VIRKSFKFDVISGYVRPSQVYLPQEKILHDTKNTFYVWVFYLFGVTLENGVEGWGDKKEVPLGLKLISQSEKRSLIPFLFRFNFIILITT